MAAACDIYDLDVFKNWPFTQREMVICHRHPFKKGIQWAALRNCLALGSSLWLRLAVAGASVLKASPRIVQDAVVALRARVREQAVALFVGTCMAVVAAAAVSLVGSAATFQHLACRWVAHYACTLWRRRRRHTGKENVTFIQHTYVTCALTSHGV